MRSAILLLLLLALCVAPAKAADDGVGDDPCPHRTGKNATLVIAESQSRGIHPGDQLRVTAGGDCVGSVTADGLALALAVWQDNPVTDGVDGATPGEPLALDVVRGGEVVSSGPIARGGGLPGGIVAFEEDLVYVSLPDARADTLLATIEELQAEASVAADTIAVLRSTRAAQADQIEQKDEEIAVQAEEIAALEGALAAVQAELEACQADAGEIAACQATVADLTQQAVLANENANAALQTLRNAISQE